MSPDETTADALPAVEEQRETNVGGVTGKGWLPGQSGNPGGRPKGRSLSALLRELLEEVDPATGKTGAERLAERLVELAESGDRQAIKEILDRLEGRPRPAAEAGHGGFLKVIVRYAVDPAPDHGRRELE